LRLHAWRRTCRLARVLPTCGRWSVHSITLCHGQTRQALAASPGTRGLAPHTYIHAYISCATPPHTHVTRGEWHLECATRPVEAAGGRSHDRKHRSRSPVYLPRGGTTPLPLRSPRKAGWRAGAGRSMSGTLTEGCRMVQGSGTSSAPDRLEQHRVEEESRSSEGLHPSTKSRGEPIFEEAATDHLALARLDPLAPHLPTRSCPPYLRALVGS